MYPSSLAPHWAFSAASVFRLRGWQAYSLDFLSSRDKFRHRQISGSDETSERALRNLSVIGNRKRSRRTLSYHDDVATTLTHYLPSEALKDFDHVTATQGGETWHYTTTSTW